MAKKIPFLSNTNRFFVWLSYVPQKLRLFLTIGLIVLGFIFWKVFFYSPLCAQIRYYKEQITNNKNQQKELRKVLNRVQGSLPKDIACGLNSPEDSYDVLDAAEDHNVIDAVLTIANNSNVACSSIMPLSKKGNSLEVGLIGTFYNIFLFLQQLRSIPAVVAVEKLECVRMQDQQISARLSVDFVRHV